MTLMRIEQARGLPEIMFIQVDTIYILKLSEVSLLGLYNDLI